jgi:hypothetical protein
LAAIDPAFDFTVGGTCRRAKSRQYRQGEQACYDALHDQLLMEGLLLQRHFGATRQREKMQSRSSDGA